MDILLRTSTYYTKIDPYSLKVIRRTSEGYVRRKREATNNNLIRKEKVTILGLLGYSRLPRSPDRSLQLAQSDYDDSGTHPTEHIIGFRVAPYHHCMLKPWFGSSDGAISVVGFRFISSFSSCGRRTPAKSGPSATSDLALSLFVTRNLK